jgi:signal transduction histidine kinase
LIKKLNEWGLDTKKRQPAPFLIDSNALLVRNDQRLLFRKLLRCRAVIFDTFSNSLLASFTDGLQRIKNNSITQVLYKDQSLYSSSMVSVGKKIYVGTFNSGLFIIDAYSVKKITNGSESSLDAIVKLKRCNNHIWVFRAQDIEMLDANTDKFVNIFPLPVDATEVTDVEEDNANIYLASHKGIYTIPIAENAKVIKEDASLLYLLVNNTDTVFNSNISLASNKNNLLFRLAIPVYENAERLHFKYRLLNGSDEGAWYYTGDAQRDLQFNALKPGSYTLEIIAIKDNEIISNKPLLYQFSISQPWFNTWWFYTGIIIIIIGASFALQQYRLKQILKIERIRRKISNDLHDDIGSTLSSINVYSELAKTGGDNKEYITTIQQSTISIINNLDDLVWNINPKNDVLENMVARMRLFAEPLFTEKNIECVFVVEADNPQASITPDLRTNIYLLFKEMINNVLKHSGCSVCNVYITQKGKAFSLAVKDNGKGFNQKVINRHRNGLSNMQQRAKDIKGSIIVNSNPGVGTEITINCYINK